MAFVNEITDGTTTVDFTSTNFHGRDRGNLTVPVLGRHRVAERVRIKLVAQASHDAAAVDFQKLIKLLRQAVEFHTSIWRTKPVYLKHQTSAETNARYALIFDVPDLELPDFSARMFEINKAVTDIEFTVVRERLWRSAAPAALGSALTLAETDSAETTPTLVHVANFRDLEDVDSIYVDDGGSFGSNLNASATATLFPATAVAGDHLYIGSAAPWKHIIFEIGTAASISSQLIFEYYNGSWTTMTLGTEFTLFAEGAAEVTDDDNLFNSTGMWAINVFPPSDWAATTINSVSKFWVRVRVGTVTSWTTSPANATNQPYSQRKNWIEVPAATIKGDSPPLFDIRLWSPSGGGVGAGPENLSRILIGAKSRGIDDSSEQFCCTLNAGGDDNPSAWAEATGTDGTFTVDEHSPGGKMLACDFATDATSINRVQFTGTSVLPNWVGEYLVLVRVQQIGGSAGDTELKLRTFIGGATNDLPHLDTPAVKTQGADKGPEVLTLGLLRLPFSRVLDVDTLTSTDVVFQVFAERTTGTSVIRIYDVIFLPVDEGSLAIDDPVTDTVNGGSALRGGTTIDIDPGVLAHRVLKYNYDGTNHIPAEPWALLNKPIEFANLGVKTRLYFLMLHYADGGTWGVEPLVANLGCHLAVEMFGHQRYLALRGSD